MLESNSWDRNENVVTHSLTQGLKIRMEMRNTTKTINHTQDLVRNSNQTLLKYTPDRAAKLDWYENSIYKSNECFPVLKIQ
jgi:hypothetical protein